MNCTYILNESAAFIVCINHHIKAVDTDIKRATSLLKLPKIPKKVAFFSYFTGMIVQFITIRNALNSRPAHAPTVQDNWQVRDRIG